MIFLLIIIAAVFLFLKLKEAKKEEIVYEQENSDEPATKKEEASQKENIALIVSGLTLPALLLLFSTYAEKTMVRKPGGWKASPEYTLSETVFCAILILTIVSIAFSLFLSAQRGGKSRKGVWVKTLCVINAIGGLVLLTI